MQEYSIYIHNAENQYNGHYPVAILQILDKDNKPATVSDILNKCGQSVLDNYLQMQQYKELGISCSVYIPEIQFLPVTTEFKYIVLQINKQS